MRTGWAGSRILQRSIGGPAALRLGMDEVELSRGGIGERDDSVEVGLADLAQPDQRAGREAFGRVDVQRRTGDGRRSGESFGAPGRGQLHL